jgi:hypothetical protein
MREDYKTADRTRDCRGRWSESRDAVLDFEEAVRTKLSTLATPTLLTLPFSGQLFIDRDLETDFPPTAASIHILLDTDRRPARTEQTGQQLPMKYFGAWRYALVDLTPPWIEIEEVVAELSPNLRRFFSMGREELISFLSIYMSQIDVL